MIKKLFWISFLFSFAITLNGQICVRYFEGSDFGLPGAETQIISLSVDKLGNKWFGLKTSYGANGLGRFDDTNWTSFTISNSDLPGNAVKSVDFDSHDSVWVATESGVAAFDGISTTAWKILNTANSDIPSNNVTAVYVDEANQKWFGFADGKMAKYNDNTWDIFSVSNSPINSIIKDSEGKVWAAINGTPGVAYFNGTDWTTIEGTAYVNDIKEDIQGDLWFCSAEVLQKYNGTIITEYTPPQGVFLRDLVIDQDKQIWLSSNMGIIEFNNGNFRIFDQNTGGIPDFSLLVGNKHPLAIDSDEKIWFGYVYQDGFAYAATAYFEKTAGLGLEISLSEHITICKGSEIILDAGSGFSSFLWSNEDNTQTTTINSIDTVSVVVSDGNNCFDYDTVIVDVQDAYNEEQICVATVGSTGKNLVVWEKTSDVETEYYNIYKQTDQANIYEVIGTVNYNELSVFVDTASRPEVHSDFYKISVIDTCGNESELSPYHKTVHLSSAIGTGNSIELSWDHYEGFDFESYIIMRGTEPGNMQDIETIASNLNQYTDFPPTEGEWFYQIAVVMPGICSPTVNKKADSGPYIRSLSNLENVESKPPPAIGITDTMINEGQAIGSFIGKLSVNDTDETHEYSFSLNEGEESDDNASFKISNDSLLSNEVFDFDVKSSFNIRILATETTYDTLKIEHTFVIGINDVTYIWDTKSDAEIRIYPIPFSDYTTIEFPNPENKTYQLIITDILGKVVRIDENIKGTKYELKKANLENGIYLIELRGVERYRGRILIE